MVKITLNSTCFESLRYDRRGEELQLRFKNGRTRVYFGVGYGLVRQMLRAKSAGRFWRERIKGQFGGVQ